MPSMAAQRGRVPVSKRGKAGVAEGREDLARAVGAEVEEEEPVAVLCAGVAGDDGGGDEFVGLAARIGGGDRLGRGGGLGALGVDDGVVGARDPFPPVVAVHRVVAARDGDDAGALGQAPP